MQKIIALFFLFCITLSASATPIKEIIFFGDSLSDNGNLYRMLKVIPKSPPYYEGRFSNGPTWAEHVGDAYREKYNTTYQIYAVGGATAIIRGPFEGALPFTIKEQVRSYLRNTRSTDRSDRLFVIWIGGNDYLDEKRQEVDALTTAVVDEIMKVTKWLIKNGGQHFVFFDLPDVAASPIAKKSDEERRNRLRILSQLHHEKMFEAFKGLKKEYPNHDLNYVDIYDIFNDILKNTESYNIKYNQHITNTSDACLRNGISTEKLPDDVRMKFLLQSTSLSVAYAAAAAKTPCANPDEYLFWDAVHPSAASHQMLAAIVLERFTGMK